MMELEKYNRSFEEHVSVLEEEVDSKLRSFRQQCVRNLINRLQTRQREWDATFRELLQKSNAIQVDPQLFGNQSTGEPHSIIKHSNSLQHEHKQVTFAENLAVFKTIPDRQTEQERVSEPTAEEVSEPPKDQEPKSSGDLLTPAQQENEDEEYSASDPYPYDLRQYFTNSTAITEFIRLQELLEKHRQQFADLNTNPALKSFKNELTIFIRTQVNSISNSDFQHLDKKIKLLTSLLSGQGVSFQDRLIDASRHPLGQLFAMDLAAQIFVTVGIRLVNSVPAIAKSMAVVINGVVKNNLALFKDLLLGHLQERCPFLVPMYPRRSDHKGQPDEEIRYRIACGYSCDPKTQALESEEKYLSRMRSMVLIYACLSTQDDMSMPWTWLASFLSLKPRPVITATVLQAFLQETSKDMSNAYGKQYRKLIAFIRDDYVKMIETITTQPAERQSLIRLKNLLADDKQLFAPPKMGSIFSSFKFN